MPERAEQVGFVGCGEMGSMVLKAALEAGVLDASTTAVAEHDAARRASLQALGVNVVSSPSELPWCDRLIFAVRPQQFADAAESLGQAERDRLVISVMAGIGSDSIRSKLGEPTRVINVMPNAPVRVKAGMSVLMPASNATSEDLEWAKLLFGTIGATSELSESDLWAVTAVSGSGPGFVALFAEAMVAAAVNLGIDASVATRLVAHTIAGTGTLLVEDGEHPSTLKAAVTTPGGTTEAGLDKMMERGIVQSIQDGIQAAHDRGESLARDESN